MDELWECHSTSKVVQWLNRYGREGRNQKLVEGCPMDDKNMKALS